jgi:hypothetical protein
LSTSIARLSERRIVINGGGRSETQWTTRSRQLSFQLGEIGDDIGAGLRIRDCEVHLGPGHQGARVR